MSKKLIRSAVTLILYGCVAVTTCAHARAGTKVVDFGWEDGVSTVLGSLVSGTAQATYSNVTMGSELDYGPTAAPFIPPIQYDVTPLSGSRMLEININPVDESNSNAVRPYLGYVQNLDAGDTIQFRFNAYDPSDGRSPSVIVDGVYAQNGDINSFAGFFTPFQCFVAGTGWLTAEGDAASPNPCPTNYSTAVDPNMIFDAGTVGDRQAVVLRARPYRPTLSTLGSGGSGSYKFFIDDMRISVTSNNPDASITLPDGSVVLVNGQIDGDFNDDGFWNCADIDDLSAAVASMGNDPNFDLNGDTLVNSADITAWLTEGGAMNPAQTGGNPFLPGDATLDGVVDGQDFITWNGNKFTNSTRWCGGNFNGDSVIDGQDFITWNQNKFMSSDSHSVVPEPTTGLLLLCAIAGLMGRRRG
jgi:hypothetical protein